MKQIVEETLEASVDVRALAALVAKIADQLGAAEVRVAQGMQARLDQTQARASRLPRRPCVYFEEWDEPMISAIGIAVANTRTESPNARVTMKMMEANRRVDVPKRCSSRALSAWWPG